MMVDRQDRVAHRLSIVAQEHANQQLAPLQRRMLHCGRRVSLHQCHLHRNYPYTIRIEPDTLMRRNRVKVNGVVTPSPVGVAIE